MTSRPTEVLTGFIGACIALYIALGGKLQPEQGAAIVGVVALIPAALTTLVELVRNVRKPKE